MQAIGCGVVLFRYTSNSGIIDSVGLVANGLGRAE
jgi:hypothetical protein